MDKTGSSRPGSEPWKRTVAVLMAAVMVAMVASPLVDSGAYAAPVSPVLLSEPDSTIVGEPPAGLESLACNALTPVKPMEIEAIYVEEIPGGTVYWQTVPASQTLFSSACDASNGFHAPGSYKFVPSDPSPMAPIANVLVYTDDWVHTSPNTLVQQALSLYGLSATVYVDGDYTGFLNDLNSGGPWDLVIWSAENYFTSSNAALFTSLTTYLQNGGKLIATCFDQYNIPASPLWAEMGFSYVSNYVVPPPCYWWDASHDIFTDPESAPQWLTRVQNSGNSQGTRIQPTANGYAVAGYTMAPAADEAAIVIRNDNKAIYKGIRDVSTNADDDTDGVMDGVELWVNMMDFVLTAGSTNGGLDKILIYADDAFHTAPNTYVDQALNGLGLPYTAHYNSDFSGFQTDLTTNGPWDLVIFGHENYGGGSAVFNDLNTYVSGGGKLIINTWQMDANPLWTTLGVSFAANDASPPDPVYWWDPGHPYFNSPRSVPELTSPAAVGYGTYACKAQPLGGFTAVAGHVPASAANEAAIVPGNGGRSIFKSFLDGQFDQDDDADSIPDGVELWINMIHSMGVWTNFPTNVAIFQTTNPWGTDAIQQVYDANTIPYTIFGTADIGVADLTMYDKIILVCGDGQDQVFFDTISDNAAWFEGYAAAGATLNIHLAPYTALTPPANLPFGLEYEIPTGDVVDIALPGHPLISSPNPISDDELDYWNSAYHSYFTAWPEYADVVLTEADTGDAWPVCLDFAWGDGRGIVTGQPVEYAWNFGYSLFLENLLLTGTADRPNPYSMHMLPDNYYTAENTDSYAYYYFTVYNDGLWEDTYDIIINGATWFTMVWDETMSYPITELGPILPGESMSFWVVVYIPWGLPPGITHTIDVVAQSQGDPSISDTSEIITESAPWYWMEAGPDMQTNFGWEGDWVEHRVWITNQGTQPDVYLPMFFEDTGNPAADADWWTKFFFVDLRPQGIYNGIDDGSETWWWGPVMPGETKEYAIKVFVPTDEIGAYDFATISITSQNDPSLVRYVDICTRLSMPAPFYDDFETAGDEGEFGLYYDNWFGLGYVSNVWTRSDPDLVGVNDMTSYSDDYSMYTSGGTVSATSCKINTEELYNGVVSCVVQRGDGAFSENPDGGEDLTIEYCDGNLKWAEWHVLGTLYGGGMPGEMFYLSWPLPEDGYNPRFQIRFRQTSGSGWYYDYWHIDDVYVGPAMDWWSMNPQAQAINAGPGTTGSCQFTIENSNYYADSYDISVSAMDWPVYVAPNPVGPLASMWGVGTFTVYVDIPADAEPLDFRTFTVTATSRINPDDYDISTVRVNVCRVHNLDQDTWYMNIQHAINAANPGEHLQALPDIYDERVLVNKPLTIIGDGAEDTIITNTVPEGLSEGGIYFVTNCIPDYGMGTNQDSRFIIENTFDWLWPTQADSGNILLVWDNDAWDNSWKEEMVSRGISWTERTGDSLAPADLDPTVYPLVIITEYMDSSSLDNMETLVGALENYVSDGGVLVDMLGTNNEMRWSRGIPGPFGVESFFSDYDDEDYIVEPTHPMVQGMTTPVFTGSSASHGRMSTPPMGSTVLITSGDVPGGDPVACWLGSIAVARKPNVRITSDDVTFTGFAIENGPIGISMESVFGCTVSGNTIRDCDAGISMESCSGNTIEGNDIRNNAGGAYIPQSIETMFATNNNQDGNMFDVTAGSEDIYIRGFDCNLLNVDVTPTLIEVYYRIGTYLGYESDPTAWTLLGTAAVLGRGANVPTPVPIGGLTIPAGETYGIYFTQNDATSTNYICYTNGANVYNDGHITISTGCGNAYPFGTTFSPRTWNGRIYYNGVQNTGPGIYIQGTGYQTLDDDFAEDNGIWTWEGISYRNGGGYCSLTDAWDYGAVGRILYNGQITSPFIAEFDYLAGGGDGADGMAMNFFKEPYSPSTGGYLGAVDGDGSALGYSLEFDNYDNGWVGESERHIAITYDSITNHLARVDDTRTEDSIWHHVRVAASGTGIVVFVDDMVTPLLNYAAPIDMTYGGFSFSAGTGGLTNNHWIDNVHVLVNTPEVNVIRENAIRNNEVGVLLWNTGALDQGNLIYHNNFLYNGLHAWDNAATSWCSDNYPAEAGNYWSGYTGPDAMSGPAQTIPGADGIIDIPYGIDADSQDLLPLGAIYNPATGRVPPTPVEVPSDDGTESESEPAPASVPTAPASEDVAPAAPPETPQEAPAEVPAQPVAVEEPAAEQPALEPAATTTDIVEPAQVPATGGSAAPMIWLAALAACAIIAGVTAFLRKRK